MALFETMEKNKCNFIITMQWELAINGKNILNLLLIDCPKIILNEQEMLKKKSVQDEKLISTGKSLHEDIE